MLSIKRFTSFTDIQPIWQELENTVEHYPFQSFWYQKLFAERFCNMEDVYLLGIFEKETLLAVGGFEEVDKKILFLGMKQVLGNQDLTDYGDILFKEDLPNEKVQEVWGAIIEYFTHSFYVGQPQGIAPTNVGRGRSRAYPLLQLDFVREDSKTYQMKSTFAKATVDKQEVAPFLVVPESWEVYLESLSRKERHELKRKIKRFEEQEAFHFCSDATIHHDFDEFVRLHRLSDPLKEKFMSEEMKQFFWDIVTAEKKDYRIDFCFLKIDGKCVASIMSLIGPAGNDSQSSSSVSGRQKKALLYNSGFDPEYSYYSVGLILHAYLIKKSIEEKISIHDFLRGNERYKYDLGAKDRQLYKIVIALNR